MSSQHRWSSVLQAHHHSRRCSKCTLGCCGKAGLLYFLVRCCFTAEMKGAQDAMHVALLLSLLFVVVVSVAVSGVMPYAVSFSLGYCRSCPRASERRVAGAFVLMPCCRGQVAFHSGLQSHHCVIVLRFACLLCCQPELISESSSTRRS